MSYHKKEMQVQLYIEANSTNKTSSFKTFILAQGSSCFYVMQYKKYQCAIEQLKTQDKDTHSA